MEGPRGVKEGESLTFGVKTQLGYTIDNVTANDEDLEADSVTDELDGSQTAWYTISEVYEEQNIQVYTWRHWNILLLTSQWRSMGLQSG